jgi:cytochrome P450
MLGPIGYRNKYQPSLAMPPVLQTIYGVARPFRYVERGWTRHGRRFTAHTLDMSPLVMLSDPSDIRAIANASAENLHSGGGGALMEPVFGQSAFMLHEKEEHASVRDAIMPAFHSKAVQGHADMIIEVVDQELASWPADTVCSLSPYIYRLTLKVMLMAAIDDREGPGGLVYGSSGQRWQVYDTLCQRMLDMLTVMATPLLQGPRLRHLPGWRGVWRKFE